MLLSKYPKSIIKELKSLYSDFNKLVIKNNKEKNSSNLKYLKEKFKILELEPNISILSILLLKNHFKIKNIALFNKIFLISELYYLGFTLHLNVQNPKFSADEDSSKDNNIKTYQVLIGDFLFTKIFEIILSLDNHDILNLFSKYNKKISEGMLEIQELSKNGYDFEDIQTIYLKIYGCFVKLCLESILILLHKNEESKINQNDFDKLSIFCQRIFSNINIYRNSFVYNSIKNSNKIEFKNIFNQLKLEIQPSTVSLDNYLDLLISRI